MKEFLLSIVRRTVRFKANPVRDLALSGATSFDWKSTGDHPVFDLEPEERGEAVPSGWVYVEARMMRRGAHLVARLYIDTGAGFSDAESIFIPATRAGNIKQIIKIPRGARRLRLAPMRSEGVVRLDFLRITEISGVERIVRMMEWVAGDIIKFKNTGQAKKYNIIWRRLLVDLKGVYEDCAKLRFHSAPLDYDSYVKKFDTLRQSEVALIRRHMSSFAKRPLISILISVREVSIDYLKSAIQSVFEQIYEEWELCIVADEGGDPKIASYLRSLPERDGRVKVVFLSAGESVSTAMNGALESAAGEFAAILDQKDVLSAAALYFTVAKINEIDDLNIIYSDTDEIDDDGVRGNVRFNSSWNPDLFFSSDNISRSATYRTSLVREIGGFRAEYEGGQDYDLALRCVKRSASSQICHIPRVLYHFRRCGEPGSVDLDVKIVPAWRGSGRFPSFSKISLG